MQGKPPRPADAELVRLAAGWFTAAAALYLVTGAQGLAWGDPSKLTLYALAGHVPSLNPGDHAGWTALAWAWLKLIPGDPVVAAHRLSAITAAVAVAGIAVLTRLRGLDRASAHTAAVMLFVAHPVWWSAGVAETYGPALAAVLAGAVAAMCGGGLTLLAGLAWGLAASIHVVALVLVAPLAWTLARRRLPLLLPGAMVGLAPLWLAVRYVSPDPLTGLASGGASTWGWHLGAFVDVSRMSGNAAIIVALAVYALGPLGLWALLRDRGNGRTPPVWWLSIAGLMALLLVYARFRLHLLLAFLVVAVILARQPRLAVAARWGHVAVQVATYALAPLVVTAAGWGTLGVRVLPYRDNARAFLDPIHRGDRGADAYLDEASACLTEGAALLADFNVGAMLRLAQVARGWRTDVAVEPVRIDLALGTGDPAKAIVAGVRAAGGKGLPVALADTWEPYYRLSDVARSVCLERCGPLALVRDCPP